MGKAQEKSCREGYIQFCSLMILKMSHTMSTGLLIIGEKSKPIKLRKE